MENSVILPNILPELSESGWFSVGLGVPKVVYYQQLWRGFWEGGSENRKVDGSIPSLATKYYP